MYRIRFHGRGGQGVRMASRILGSAFFLEGFNVQDAPRYGAERRGAPIFAYVRADHGPINERGIISRPDLVVVADDSLVQVQAAGVLMGISDWSCLLMKSAVEVEVWRDRLHLSCPLFTLSAGKQESDPLAFKYIGAMCAGAAAGLTGIIEKKNLQEAFQQELAEFPPEILEKNIASGLQAFDAMAIHAGCLQQGEKETVHTVEPPAWIDLPFEEAVVSAPAIHAPATSVLLKTGLWRTMRPVIDYEKCNRCWWLCSTFCPDGTISVDEERYPRIDYEHCKGCMICLAQCPTHAIAAVPEHQGEAEKEGEQS